jgi:F-type H+-transporting ATPase subunit delta
MIAELEYAKALFMLAEEEDTCEATLLDLRTVIAAVKKNESYLELLDTPALSKEEKLSLIDEAFKSISVSVVNFIKILCEKRFVRILPSVLKEYEALYDEKFGILRVEAISARPMSHEQLEALREKLEKEKQKTVVLTNTVNPEILGGLKLRFSGVQLDGSLKTRLDKIEASLKNVIV